MFKFYLMAALCFCSYCTISAQTHTPVAQAGADAFIVLPANLSFNGLQSSDPDGMIVSYHRRKISVRASHLFSDSTIPNPTVQNLTTGLYSFELTVTDNRNASAADSISIQVLSDAPFTWDGAISADWQNAANWKDNLPPSSAGIVIIPAGRLHYPIIQTPISVKSLFCATGAAVTVASNGSLRISGTTNLPPVANAGSDISIVLPLDSVTLRGCTSNDPEGGSLRYKWRKISGPAQSAFTNDTLCNSKVRGLVAGNYSFELLVTDSENFTNKDTVQLSVQGFSFAWPVLPAPTCPQAYNVVILGSSTAFGTGASPLDSSWAKKFKKYVQQQNAQVTVTNLALGGYNSYHVNPTGFIPAADKPAPDTARNITAALALNPDAIIINLPSNDAAAAFTLQESQANFNRIVAVADSQNVPVWVTTSQPRSGLSAGATNNLILLKDWVLQRFGNKAIDFWTDIANADGSVNTYYSAGDGVHINNFGHHTVFARVLQEKLWDSICIRRTAAVNIPPFANAGTDVLLHWPADSISLNGTASNDQDGTIIQYKWQKIQGGNATIVNDGIANPWVRDLAVGNYSFELVVTDDSLAVDKDTVMVRVNEQPVARAGLDGSITLPVHSISLNGSSSNDPDESVTIFGWREVSGPAGDTITNSAASQTNVSFHQHQHVCI